MWLGSARAQLLVAGVDAEAAFTCALRHGTGVDALLVLIESDRALAQRVHPDAPFIRAEVALAQSHEMARSEQDVLRRRMPLHLIVGG